MRNDSFDEVEHIPSLRTETRAADPLLAGRGETRREQRAGNGFLWFLVLALMVALAGLGWWSRQRLELMEQQLVATQESFARISEDAALRIQSISGKVVAAESSASSGSEALRSQLRHSENRLTAQDRRHQALQARHDEQEERLGRLAGDLQKQRELTAELVVRLDGRLHQFDEQLQALAAEQSALQGLRAEQEQLVSGLGSLDKEVTVLKQRADPGLAIDRLQQELLALRGELDRRLAQSGSLTSIAEFDTFRAQTTRRFNALQNQVRSLQQQLGSR